MALTFIVTNAGRAALVNAANTGTAPVTIAQVGFTATAVTPTPVATTLPGEFKRLATLSGDVVADDTIHLIVRDESGDVFTVRSLAMYLADGTLFGIYGQAGVLIEKSAQAMMLLGIDVKFEDIAATTITFGNANFLNPPATTERMGVVELSTLTETIAGLDTTRVPAAKMVKDAVTAWLDARFGASNSGIWHPANDGAGSGLDADLLDGQQGSYYSNITARLGYTPVQQGTGNGQLGNTVKLGWSGARLKATVDVSDMGNFVFDGHIADVWRASNDGAGSGLDADLLDGQDGSYYANITARLGYTPLNKAGDTINGTLTFGPGSSADFATNDIWPSIRVFRNNRAGSDGMFIGYGNANSGRTRIYGDGSTGAFVFPDGGGNLYRSDSALYWHSANDGSGSGLDADLLDGAHASWFADIPARLGYTPVNKAGDVMAGSLTVNANNTSGGGLILSDDGDIVDLNDTYCSMRFSGGVRIFSANKGGSPVITLGSNGTILVNGNIVWHAGNDGSGSGLDADLVDGWHRDSIRDWNNLLNKPFNWSGQAGQPQWLWGSNDGGAYYVWNPSNFNVAYAAGAGNADTVDGYHASALLPTGNLEATGYCRLPNGLILQWGTIYCNSDSYGSVTFPISFPTACFHIHSGVATELGNGNAQANCILPYSANQNGANFWNAAPASTAWWMAIGK